MTSLPISANQWQTSWAKTNEGVILYEHKALFSDFKQIIRQSFLFYACLFAMPIHRDISTVILTNLVKT